MAERDLVYAKHILNAIATIEQFLAGKKRDDFDRDKLLQDGVVREIEIIGEAAKNISPEFKKSVPEIQWKDIAGMRDKLIHEYFSVSTQAVWDTAHEDIAELKTALQSHAN